LLQMACKKWQKRKKQNTAFAWNGLGLLAAQEKECRSPPPSDRNADLKLFVGR